MLAVVDRGASQRVRGRVWVLCPQCFISLGGSALVFFEQGFVTLYYNGRQLPFISSKGNFILVYYFYVVEGSMFRVGGAIRHCGLASGFYYIFAIDYGYVSFSTLELEGGCAIAVGTVDTLKAGLSWLGQGCRQGCYHRRIFMLQTRFPPYPSFLQQERSVPR